MEHETLKSCCFYVDKAFIALCTAALLVVAGFSLCVYKIVTAESCASESPFYILLSTLTSVSATLIFTHRRNRPVNFYDY